MRIRVLAFTLLAGFTAPAFSQDSTQLLREAFDHLPQVVGTNPAPIHAYFFDVQAWGHAEDKQVPITALNSLFFARSIEPLRQLSFQAGDVWAEKSGVSLKDVAYFAGFGELPQSVSYWGLRDEAAAGHLMDTLKTKEFVEVPGPVAGVFGNGDPKHGMDLTKSDASNPWRGPTGKIYFVKQLGNAIVQSLAPEAIAALSETKPSLAESKVVSAALDGWDATVGVDEGSIIQAAVISPGFGVCAGDPAKLLTQKPADANRAIKEDMRKAQEGVPPYLGGILADVRKGDRSGLEISLVYPDCGTADMAVESIKERWSQNPLKDIETDVSAQSVANNGEPCVAIVTLMCATFEGSRKPDPHACHERLFAPRI